jgi:predicted nucleic acid-binding protein
LSSYADTSFLVSLYTPDRNSPQAVERMKDAALPLLCTSFGEVELTNAFQLLLFRKYLNADEVRASYGAFRSHMRAGVIRMQPLADETFETARQLSLRHTAKFGVRTLDILHVASALLMGAKTFHTFDKNQTKLAATAGLKVV